MGHRAAVAAAASILFVALAASASAQDVTAPPPQQDQTATPPPATPPPAATPAPAVATADGQKENGFVLEVDVGTQIVSLGGGVAFPLFSALEGGFFAGFKAGDLQLGLGIEFARVHTSSGGPGGDRDETPIVVQPGLRYTFVHSDDHRVDLYGEVDVGIGHSFNDPDVNNIVLRYAVGPGVRFWIHPQFALAALTGVNGIFYWTNGPWSLNDTHAVFASIALLGVF